MSVTYTDEIAEEICRRIALGESLRAICRDKAAGMPDQSTVTGWLNRSETFVTQYARARELQADTHVDYLVDIADETPAYIEDDDGGRRVDPGHVQWQRVRIDVRKWAAGKMRPKKYGDKIDHTVASPDGGPVEHIFRFETEPKVPGED